MIGKGYEGFRCRMKYHLIMVPVETCVPMSTIVDKKQLLLKYLSILLHRPLSWIESQNMGAFLCVAKGSQEKPWLLELKYNYRGVQDDADGGGGEERPIALVGKGNLSNCPISFAPD